MKTSRKHTYETSIVFFVRYISTMDYKFLDMQISSHSYQCDYLYIYLMCTLCYNMYICSIILSVIKQYWNVATAVPILSLKCYIQMGNSIEHYNTAIGLFNPRKGCLYGLENCWVDSYQQIMLTNFLCSVFALYFFYRVRFRKLL